MGTRTKVVQKSNQATPLSQDVMSILSNALRGIDPSQANSSTGPLQMAGGRISMPMLGDIAFPGQQRGGLSGFPSGGLTNETQVATDALMRLVRGGFNPDVRDVASPGQYITDMENVLGRTLSRSAADLREGFSNTGNRFGSSMALGEARLRSDALDNFAETLSGLELNLNELGINRDLGVARLRSGVDLGAIGALSQLGNQNIMPFLQLASQGIVNPEIIASPSVAGQLGTALLSGAGTFLGGLGAGGFFTPKGG